MITLYAAAYAFQILDKEQQFFSSFPIAKLRATDSSLPLIRMEPTGVTLVGPHSTNSWNSAMGNESRIIESRLGRLGKLGLIAGGVAGGALSEGARQLIQGRRPTLGSALFSSANASRLSDRLAEMRGAAMKVGQLLSMESGELLPPELAQALTRLRDNAHVMPLGQVAAVLKQSWGEGWDRKFRRFNFQPLAAASIGQVHVGERANGRELAIKIQYPGIRRSIDSDVDNVAALLRILHLIPREIEIQPLLDDAKHQLHAEANYLQEAAYLKRFARLTCGDNRYEVPAVDDELTTSEVLAMQYLNGEPIESLAGRQRALRNQIGTTLLELGLREVFDWGLVQTDPNFANFRYNSQNGAIQLLDFGATREYSVATRAALGNLIRAGMDGLDEDLLREAAAVGYIDENDPKAYRRGVLVLVRAATEPARSGSDYDFGQSDLARRISDMALELRINTRYGRLPPPDVLFLHRKLGGLYLLFSRLNVSIPVRQLLTQIID